jgi:hypothetical protein
MNKPKDVDGCFDASNCSTAFFNSEDMLRKMRELSEKMQAIPNVLVTTKRTLGQLRKVIDAQKQQYFAGAIPSLHMKVYGTPIEDYETVKDCLDRMMEPRKGERLKLVLSEDIPGDCIDHPWMKEQVRDMAERMGYDWMFFKESGL